MDYSSDKLGLRISRDRGQLLVFLSSGYAGHSPPSENDRVNATLVFESLGMNVGHDLRSLARAIDENYDLLCRLFAGKEAREALMLKIQKYLQEHPRDFGKWTL